MKCILASVRSYLSLSANIYSHSLYDLENFVNFMECSFWRVDTSFHRHSAIVPWQVEKEKQDDALSDLSNILGELKDMAVDMGCEIDRLVILTRALQIDMS